jgi:hypothetical protein
MVALSCYSTFYQRHIQGPSNLTTINHQVVLPVRQIKDITLESELRGLPYHGLPILTEPAIYHDLSPSSKSQTSASALGGELQNITQSISPVVVTYLVPQPRHTSTSILNNQIHKTTNSHLNDVPPTPFSGNFLPGAG